MDSWDCKDWTLAVIRKLAEEGIMLFTQDMDEGRLFNRLIMDMFRATRLSMQMARHEHGSRPVFVPLSS